MSVKHFAPNCSKCKKGHLKQLDMYLWNTDAPGGQQNQHLTKSPSHTFWPRKPPGQCGVSKVWATLTYSPSLVTVWPPKLKLLHFIYRQDRMVDRQTDGWTDDPIPRCPGWPFRLGGIKILQFELAIIQKGVINRICNLNTKSTIHSSIYLRIECLILSVYWSINVRWRLTNCVNLRSEAEQVYAQFVSRHLTFILQ